MRIDIPESLKELSEKSGVSLYVVGGFVRNSILFHGTESTDIDIAGSLTPDLLRERLTGIAKVKDVSPRIGTVLVRYNHTSYEYTTFRKDSYPKGGVHTPHTVEFVKDLSADYKRRDFTVNAMYADVLTGEVIDLCNGLADISDKLIRTVRTSGETFDEDGLRLLRLVRFASELGFEIEKSTYDGAKQFADRLADISIERKREELDKILYSDFKYGLKNRASFGLGKIKELGLWQYFLKDFDLTVLYDKATLGEKLDNSSALSRLVVFALLFADFDEQTIDRVFGRLGLGYPNLTLKEMQTAREYLSVSSSEKETMLFLAKNKNYIELLDDVAKTFAVSPLPSAVFEQILSLGLPIRLKDLQVGKKEFEEYDIDNDNRSVVLNEMFEACYDLKRTLTDSEKVEILKKYGGK